MTVIDPSPNIFPLASQEFALVGDTADPRFFEGILNSQEKFLNFTIIPPIEACPIWIIDSL